MKPFFKRFGRHRPALISLIFLALLSVACFAAPLWCWLLGLDPYTPDVSRVYAPFGGEHPLGADDLGRDFLARLFYGGRLSLVVALLGSVASLAVGGLIGLCAGYFGGWWDSALMRFTDAMMALPKLPLMMLLAAVDLSKVLPWPELAHGSMASVVKLLLVIVLFGWMTNARLARALALQLRSREFVEAARALGLSRRRVLLRHVLPNALGPMIVAATIDLGEFIIYESVLSFLGLGIQPPMPSWGAMLSKGLTYLYEAPALMILPGLLTFLTVAAFNFAGDGIRDALDPRHA